MRARARGSLSHTQGESVKLAFIGLVQVVISQVTLAHPVADPFSVSYLEWFFPKEAKWDQETTGVEENTRPFLAKKREKK